MKNNSSSWIDQEVEKWGLDAEEREILEASLEDSKHFLPEKEQEAIKMRLRAAARMTIERAKKSESISIRLSPIDLARIKAKAADEGIGYQTLISSIIHKYAFGKK